MFAWLWEVNFSKFFVFTGQFTIENNWDLFAARVTLLNGEGNVVKEAPTQMCKQMFGAEANLFTKINRKWYAQWY